VRYLTLILVLAGCIDDEPPDPEQSCDVILEPLMESGTVGEAFTIRGGPQTDARDTSVFVSGANAPVLSVDSCDTCYSCRQEQKCDPCGVCPPCEDECAVCDESVVIEVPNLSSGSHPVQLVNAYGTSNVLSLDIDGGTNPDTGSGGSPTP